MSFPTHSVAELIEVQPRRHKLKTDEYQVTGAVPIVDQGAALIAGFTDALDRVYDGPLPVVIFGDHTCCLKYIDFPFAIGADGTQVLRPVDGVDARFLYFALHTTNLEQFGYQRHFKLLKDSQISLPPLATQSRIVSILGGYDDLIEVNRRRVAVLEEMARGLFEEWFVRFRFPGHESVPIVDTPDGPLPQGWSFAPLEEFLVLQRGFDLPKSKRGEGAVPVFSASGFHGGHSEAKVAAPGVVTGRSGTIGQVHLIMEDYWPLNTTLYVREFRRAGPAYALLLLRRLDLAQHASGAAVPTLNRNHIHGIKLPAAPQPLMDRFEQFAFANFQNIRSIDQANERLAASRDLLLPRLISGKISVEAAERDLELAA